jgi:chromosome segregation ATPase
MIAAPSIEHDLDRALVETLELQDAITARDASLDACAARIEELLDDVKAKSARITALCADRKEWIALAETLTRQRDHVIDVMNRHAPECDRAHDRLDGRLRVIRILKRAGLSLATRAAEEMTARAKADLTVEMAEVIIAEARTDRDHWRRVAETEIDGRSADLEEIARLTEDRDAWQRAAERERVRAEACERALETETWRKR